MSAEGVDFAILKKTLDEIFFPEYELEPGVWCNKRHREWTYKIDGDPICPKTCDLSVYNPTGKCTCSLWDQRSVDLDKLIHFYEIHKKLLDEGNDFPLVPECVKILRKYIRIKKVPKLDGLTFYTIVPKERLPFNVDQIDKLKAFCYKEFTERNFSKCAWIIEAGKHKENPNLHIHCIGKLKNKNFKREFIGHWNKSYEKKYNISYEEKDNRGWDKYPCNTLEIQKDKLNYLNNSLKGSHENFVDLEVGDKFGW